MNQSLILAAGVIIFILIMSKPSPAARPMMTYKNEEIWEIVRDYDTGRIQSITVHRDAQSTS